MRGLLGDRAATLPLGEGAKDVVVERRFSNKPKSGAAFADHYEKIDSYVTIICGPAMSAHGVDPYDRRRGGAVARFDIFEQLRLLVKLVVDGDGTVRGAEVNPDDAMLPVAQD